MGVDSSPIVHLYQLLDGETRASVDAAAERIIACKRAGGKVMIATGSGPNLHEGVTTLIAELMDKGLIDGVSTSSAVIAHEMAGTLDRVKRVDGKALGFRDELPRGDVFEITVMDDEELRLVQQEMVIDVDLIRRARALEGKTIIKAAGNMAYPMGLRTERLAREILAMAKAVGEPFETVAGWGADPRTMIGVGAARGIPVLVSVPQLIGGGAVGLSVADSISIFERSARLARMIASADVIIESAVALTQEIHDGPFELSTGHGIWAAWDGYATTRLESKTLVRVDLDPNLRRAWVMEREGHTVQAAIDSGLPKTKLTGIPFRMEMSGFARLPGSIPVVGDIGVIMPILAWKVADAMGTALDFISAPQQTPEGAAMRNWIADTIRPIRRDALMARGRLQKA